MEGSLVNRNRAYRIAIIGLIIALFPIFGLDKMDNSGLEKSSLTNSTFILRSLWVGICGIFFFVIIQMNQKIKQKNGIIFSALFSKSLLLYFTFSAISIFLNGPGDFISWIKLGEHIVIVGLCLMSLRVLALLGVPGGVIKYIFLKYTFYSFLIAAAIVLFLAVIDIGLAFSFAERGLRMGGYVIHPNTLSLGAVLGFIALMGLRIHNRKAKKFFIPFLIICIGVLLSTRSSSGLFTFVIVAFFFLFTRINIKYRPFFIFLFSLIVLVFISYKTNLFKVEDKGTWSDRVIIYQASQKGIEDNLIIGVGPFGGVKRYFTRIMPIEYMIPTHSHNVFISMVMSRGILGFLPFLFLVIMGFYYMYKYFIIKESFLNICILLIFFAIIFHGFFESSVGEQLKPFCQVPFFATLYLMSITKKKTNIV